MEASAKAFIGRKIYGLFTHKFSKSCYNKDGRSFFHLLSLRGPVSAKHWPSFFYTVFFTNAHIFCEDSLRHPLAAAHEAQAPPQLPVTRFKWPRRSRSCTIISTSKGVVSSSRASESIVHVPPWVIRSRIFFSSISYPPSQKQRALIHENAGQKRENQQQADAERGPFPRMCLLLDHCNRGNTRYK